MFATGHQFVRPPYHVSFSVAPLDVWSTSVVLARKNVSTYRTSQINACFVH